MPKQKSKKKSGPYLAAAVFCESVLEEKDGVHSAVRIVDQLNIIVDSSAPHDFPSKEHPLPIRINALIMFRSGDSPGEHLMRLILEGPSGKMQELIQQTVILSAQPSGGLSSRIIANFNVGGAGLF